MFLLKILDPKAPDVNLGRADRRMSKDPRQRIDRPAVFHEVTRKRVPGQMRMHSFGDADLLTNIDQIAVNISIPQLNSMPRTENPFRGMEVSFIYHFRPTEQELPQLKRERNLPLLITFAVDKDYQILEINVNSKKANNLINPATSVQQRLEKRPRSKLVKSRGPIGTDLPDIRVRKYRD
jgi:hypothetical protein